MYKKNYLPLGAFLLAGILMFGTIHGYAASPDMQTTLIERIAQKFNLKQADVKSVFDQYRSERQAEMQKKYDEKLAQLVKEGKISDAQKQLIMAKHKEIQQKMQNLTPEQRKANMETNRKLLEDWAKQNGIDPQYVYGGIGKFGHRQGMGKMMK